jgi:pimeloyl-ACP methyl ester carboxylesterase
MTLRHMAEDLDLFRQHSGLEKLDIIAHASVATIALAHAIMNLGGAGKLVLINPDLLGYDRSDMSFFAAMGKVQIEMHPKTDEELKKFMFVILPRLFAYPVKLPTIQAKWTDTPSIWAFGAYYAADMKTGWK